MINSTKLTNFSTSVLMFFVWYVVRDFVKELPGSWDSLYGELLPWYSYCISFSRTFLAFSTMLGLLVSVVGIFVSLFEEPEYFKRVVIGVPLFPIFVGLIAGPMLLPFVLASISTKAFFIGLGACLLGFSCALLCDKLPKYYNVFEAIGNISFAFLFAYAFYFITGFAQYIL